MKVLIVSKYDKDGGAAIAAYRLHRALIAAGKNSKMLVQKKLTQDSLVLGPKSLLQKFFSKISYYIDQLPVYVYRNKSAYLFSPAWYSSGDILKQINDTNSDVVHLHWSCKGMLSTKDIEHIKAPVILTMHDSWAFTGGCHIPFDCKKYKEFCGSCPELASNRQNDLSSKAIIKKSNLYDSKSDIVFVAVSKWLQNCARSSNLLKTKNIYCIPNALDTSRFKPIEKSLAKSYFGFKSKKKLILFGALSALTDKNKGFKELYSALNHLSSSEWEIGIFGSERPKEEKILNFKTYYFGNISNDEFLRKLYSSADVMVVPSKLESFGQTASEALSCGTPVVAFDTSGLRDIVKHKVNGYLAKAFDSRDLANGIQWVLNAKDYDLLVTKSREIATQNFDGNIVVQQYIRLYKKSIYRIYESSNC